MEIKSADEQADFDEVWEIFRKVISTGDTYVFDPATPKDNLHPYWFADYMDTFVAVDDAKIAGTYIIKPNQIGLGDHVANCSYMVDPGRQGHGIGKALCEHSIDFARKKGYLAIQFNLVVSTNEGAVALWRKFGFEIIGRIPKAFRHRRLGLVDALIMHKDLATDV